MAQPSISLMVNCRASCSISQADFDKSVSQSEWVSEREYSMSFGYSMPHPMLLFGGQRHHSLDSHIGGFYRNTSASSMVAVMLSGSLFPASQQTG